MRRYLLIVITFEISLTSKLVQCLCGIYFGIYLFIRQFKFEKKLEKQKKKIALFIIIFATSSFYRPSEYSVRWWYLYASQKISDILLVMEQK